MSAVIGDVHHPWKLVPLKDLGQWSGGGTPSKSNPEYWTEGSIPWVSPKDMKTARIADSEDHITTAAVSHSAAKLIAPGSVLVVTRSGILSHTLPVAVTDVPVTVNQDLKALTPRQDVLPEYVAWALRCFSREILKTCSKQGTTVASIETAALQRFEIPLAPLEDQRSIVAEIEKQFSRLDEAVANLNRVKANLKRYKAVVLKTAVEGRLVETEAGLARREGRPYESADELIRQILTDSRKGWSGRGKYKEPVSAETDGLPSVPAGWTWVTVAQLAAPERNAITDGPFGSNLKTAHYTDAGPRVIRLQNIGDGEFVDEYAHIAEEHFQRLRKHEVHAGDLIIATLGEKPPRACILPLQVGPGIVKADCIRFKPHSSVSSAYLNIALNSEPTRRRTKDQLHGVGRPRLSLGEIKAIALPLPPAEEQLRIVAEVDRLLSVARMVDTSVQHRLLAGDRLRRGVLQTAFQGKSDPPQMTASALAAEPREAPLEPYGPGAPSDSGGDQVMDSVKKAETIRAVLAANSEWLSTSALLTAAGFGPNTIPQEMERFYLELRDALQEASPRIEVERRNGIDYFRKV
jgi:type I restriction enzyme S subunit